MKLSRCFHRCVESNFLSSQVYLSDEEPCVYSSHASSRSSNSMKLSIIDEHKSVKYNSLTVTVPPLYNNNNHTEQRCDMESIQQVQQALCIKRLSVSSRITLPLLIIAYPCIMLRWVSLMSFMQVLVCHLYLAYPFYKMSGCFCGYVSNLDAFVHPLIADKYSIRSCARVLALSEKYEQ